MATLKQLEHRVGQLTTKRDKAKGELNAVTEEWKQAKEELAVAKKQEKETQAAKGTSAGKPKAKREPATVGVGASDESE